MKRMDIGTAAGVLLVGVGALLLLQNLLVIHFAWGLIWAFLFAVSGILFLTVYLRDREHWWSLIPGLTLLAIGGLIGLEGIVPGGIGDWGGSIVLGGISLAFWGVYYARRDFWWVLIPAGTLLTLAVAVGFSSLLEGDLFVGVFFLGMALTFAAVYFVPRPEGRMSWALIPAGVMAVMGMIFLATATSLFGYLWPALIILGGLFLLFRTYRKR